MAAVCLSEKLDNEGQSTYSRICGYNYSEIQNQNFDAKKLSAWGRSTLLHSRGHTKKEYLETHFWCPINLVTDFWRIVLIFGEKQGQKRLCYTEDVLTNACVILISIVLKGRRKWERPKVSTQTNLFDENVFLFFLLVSTRQRTKCSFIFSLFSSQS